MQIYNKEPILDLWEMLKSLAVDIPIYKEVMTSDENSIPESYILLRSDVTNSGMVYGDGIVKVRSSDCDIMLISKGFADDTKSLHNINKKKIDNLLKSQDVSFVGTNIGYDDGQKSSQYTWSIEVFYNG